MGKVIIKIWGDKNNIKVRNKEKKEIGITTDRKDYHAELDGLVWNRDKKGYIKNRSVGYLHKYIMEKWYGEETVEKFYQTSSILPYAAYPSQWSSPVKPDRNSIGWSPLRPGR